jgi:dTDP-4-dehydrorhamnose reductase
MNAFPPNCRSRPIVILGAGGMLGRELAAAIARAGLPCSPFGGRADLDIADSGAVGRALDRLQPVAVFNAAGWTDVDSAEADEASADAANHLGPRHVAAWCAANGARLIHFSTDYVFDGLADRPYRTDDPTSPAGAYGRTKLAGERAIAASGCKHLIIRTSWLYAEHGRNFVRTILRLAGEKRALNVVNDQRGRPTHARDLATTALGLDYAGARGVHHVANDGECSWFEFASEIVRLSGLDCRVNPCSTAEFPRPAKRPGYSVLDLSGTTDLLGPIRHWREALAECVESIARGSAAAPVSPHLHRVASGA